MRTEERERESLRCVGCSMKIVNMKFQCKQNSFILHFAAAAAAVKVNSIANIAHN